MPASRSSQNPSRTVQITHLVTHTAFLCAVVPSFALLLSSETWVEWQAAIQTRAAWENVLYLQLFLLPAIILSTAAQEFFTRGRGTPAPFDPTTKLVTTGIYGYVRNPMQLGKIGIMFAIAAVFESEAMVFAGVLGLAVGLALNPLEDMRLLRDFGEDFQDYRTNVRRFLPRWRPWAAAPSTTVVLKADCEVCMELGQWLRKNNLTGLKVDLAESIVKPMFYSHGEDSECGIRAIARSIEHVNLFWAFYGFCLRLPILAEFFESVFLDYEKESALTSTRRYTGECES